MIVLYYIVLYHILVKYYVIALHYYYNIIRVRVLGTDYCSPWARELTRALLPGSEFFAAAAAAATLLPSNLTSSRTYI